MSEPMALSLQANPRITSWLDVEDGLIHVRVGKVELGQGIRTALSAVAAESLGVRLDQVVMRPLDTTRSPNEGATAGSFSLEQTGRALRQVCLSARELFRACAAHPGHLTGTVDVEDGVFVTSTGTTLGSYWDLADRVDLAVDVTDDLIRVAADRNRVVASIDPPRTDLNRKILGAPDYIHDLELPDMLHGRVVRPPGPGASLVEVGPGVAEELAATGVEIVRDGDFLGVVGADEWRTVKAAEVLRQQSQWTQARPLPRTEGVCESLWAAPAHETEVLRHGSSATEDAVVVVDAHFYRPYLMHGSIGTSCAIARWPGEGSLEVWTHSQGCFDLRRDLALALGMSESEVVVEHRDGAGAYGSNPADDVAMDAALLARGRGGRPVRVVLSRRDELAWDPLGPAMVARVRATADAAGRIRSWSHLVKGSGHLTRPGCFDVPALLGAELMEGGVAIPPALEPGLERGGGNQRNAIPYYDFPDVEVRQSTLTHPPLRTSALRALGAGINVFAIESTLDEVAEQCGVDPVRLRLDHLTDPRARAVVAAAAELADWDRARPDGTGLGIGFARYKNKSGYCAVVAEVEALDDVVVSRLFIVADVGRVVSMDGLRNQLEGGAVQATSWALVEEVQLDGAQVLSEDWETYPILRFTQMPQLDVLVLDRPEETVLGAGEIAQGPTVAAIGNALSAAVGVRVRRMPFTRAQVVAAIES